MKLRLLAGGALTLLAVALLSSPVSALSMAAPASPIQRLFLADIVVIGTVTAIEEEPVEALPFPNAPQKSKYRVAVMKIDNSLRGAGSLTHVKVGFIPPVPQPAHVPRQPVAPGQPVLIAPELPAPPPGTQLTEKLSGCFFLTKHPTESFYTIRYDTPPLISGTKNAEDEIALVKKALEVTADPLASLQARKPEDRYFAAAALIAKYRSIPHSSRPTGKPGTFEQEPIPAEESSRILTIMAEQDKWNQPVQTNVDAPIILLNQIGIGPNDGWTYPRVVRGDFATVVRDQYRKWLTNQGKDYVIKKFVP